MEHSSEQANLWSNTTSVIEELEATVDRARGAWQAIRMRHAIGSPEEQQYWDAYRAASERLWEYRWQYPS